MVFQILLNSAFGQLTRLYTKISSSPNVYVTHDQDEALAVFDDVEIEIDKPMDLEHLGKKY